MQLLDNKEMQAQAQTLAVMLVPPQINGAWPSSASHRDDT
jgi:hypothetical protein